MIGALVAGYYRDGKLIYAGRVGTGYTRTVAQGPVEAAASARDRQAAVRRDSAGRSAPPRRALGRAEDGDRSRSFAAGPATTSCGRRRSRACARTSRRRRSSARLPAEETDVPRQRAAAGRPRRSSTVGGQEIEALRRKPKAAPQGRRRRAKAQPRATVRRRRRRPLHPSGSRLLGRRRRHQAGSRRLLPVGVGSGWRRISSNVPLSLLRCPDGTKGQCFFQKHASAGLNDDASAQRHRHASAGR